MLVTTVFATAVSKKGFGNTAPIAIGLAILVAVGSCGMISGGAFNPARFFGPAIVWGCAVSKIWVYWLAELMGGAGAGLLWRFVQKPVIDAQAQGEEKRSQDIEMAQTSIEMPHTSVSNEIHNPGGVPTL